MKGMPKIADLQMVMHLMPGNLYGALSGRKLANALHACHHARSLPSFSMQDTLQALCISEGKTPLQYVCFAVV